MFTKDEKNKPKIRSYFPELDGLRAFAVIAVIINHTNKDLIPSGFLGVDIFFVLSGYVITLSILRRKYINFLEFLTGFYQRRIKRLMPALVFCIIINSIFICFFNYRPGTSLMTGLFSIFGLSNIFLISQSTNYFGESTDFNIFTNTWSLAVEEQFYFIYPLILYFTLFRRKTNFSTKSFKDLFVIILFFSITSLILFISFSKTNQPISYFSLPTRFWEIGLGCIAGIIGKNNNQNKQRQSISIDRSIFLIVITSLFFLPLKLSIYSTIFCSGLTFSILLLNKKEDYFYKVFSNKKIVFIGKISYSLYLWHWPILSLGRWSIGISSLTIPFLYLIIISMSLISYFLIEIPCRNLSSSNGKLKSYLLIFNGFILPASLIIFLGKFVEGRLFLGNKDSYSYSVSEYKKKKCSNSREKNFIPNTKYFENCWVNKNSQNKEKNKKLFFYGNSYNEQLLPLLDYYLPDRRNSINYFSSIGCIVSKELISSDQKNKNICRVSFENYLKFFDKHSKPGDKLIIASSLHHFLSDFKYKLKKNNILISTKDAFNIYKDEIKNLSLLITKENKNLIYVSAIPYLNLNPKICSQKFSSLNINCDYESRLNIKKNKEVKLLNQKLANLSSLNNFYYVNIFDSLENKLLNPNSNNLNLYFNKWHISNQGVKSIVKEFKFIFEKD